MQSYPSWCVQSVQPQQDYTLIVTFITGEKKLFDAKPLLDWEVFEPLKNKELFLKAYVSGHTVVWTDDIDIDPEELYHYGTAII